MTGPLPRVMIFARTPVPGEVKTRLAEDVGAERAARIYEALAAGTVERLRGGEAARWELEVHFTPPDRGSESFMRRWLEEALAGGVAEGSARGPAAAPAFVPQAEGDLGMRMESALRVALSEGPPAACVVASDVPDLGPLQVGAGLRALEEGADVVFGPSPDGGYYLVALSSPQPSLFRGIPWSTPEVLERSLAAAHEASLRVHLLDPLRDVDRAADLPPGLEPA